MSEIVLTKYLELMDDIDPTGSNLCDFHWEQYVESENQVKRLASPSTGTDSTHAGSASSCSDGATVDPSEADPSLNFEPSSKGSSDLNAVGAVGTYRKMHTRGWTAGVNAGDELGTTDKRVCPALPPLPPFPSLTPGESQEEANEPSRVEPEVEPADAETAEAMGNRFPKYVPSQALYSHLVSPRVPWFTATIVVQYEPPIKMSWGDLLCEFTQGW